jgi:hypothetical protein
MNKISLLQKKIIFMNNSICNTLQNIEFNKYI